MVNENVSKVIQMRLEKTAKALEKNNMQAFVVQTKEEAAETVKSLIKKGDVIASGGSATLKECGIIDLVKSADYDYIDRNAANSPDEIKAVYRKSFSADVYLSSANAITENGELYNVDGNSNRVAAIAYGPDSVIIVAGYNKIVADINAASVRVKKCAAPPNTIRLNCGTPCSKTGECAAFSMSSHEMTSGCAMDGRICCNYLISARQRHKNRIKVILVAENLGF